MINSNYTYGGTDISYNITEIHYIMTYESDENHRANVFKNVFFSTLRVLLYGMVFGLLFAWYRHRRRKIILNSKIHDGTPVVVTSTTHTEHVGYPVSQMPPPSGMPGNVYAPPYPYNMTGTSMPMQPPPPGFQQPYPAYPPMGIQPTAANMNPPSYAAAVSGVGTGIGNTAPYEKQSAYNPNYSGQQ